MKHLIIIGARGFGRETFSLAKSCEGYGVSFVVKGFLDDKSDALQGFNGYPPILDSVESYVPGEEDVFICALGVVKWKKHYADIILQKGGVFINLIHPSVILNDNVRLGIGLIVFHGTFISNDITIGNFVTIHNYCIFGHDIAIGDWCHIGAFSFMGGFAMLEEEVTLNVRSTVLPKVRVRSKAAVGASSLVIKSVKENTTVFGSPAQILKF